MLGRRRNWFAALVAAIAVVAGCTGGTQTTGTPVAQVSLAGAPLTLPAGWHATQFQDLSSFAQLIAFVGPDPVTDPCTRTPNSSSCGNWPSIQLHDNDVLAAIWQRGGPPGNVPDMTTGEAVTVADRPGRLTTVSPDDGCRAMGGDEELQVIVPDTAIWNWQELDACLRGPDHATAETQVRALITDLHATTTEQPMDTSPTWPNDNGYVESPGQLRLRSLTLSYPTTWNAIREPYGRLDRVAIVTMGPDMIPACDWADCAIWPDVQLPAGGLIVSVWTATPESWTLDTAPGQTITVAGRPAKLAIAAADDACRAIGGTELMTAQIPDDPGSTSIDEVDACLREPATAEEMLVRQILASGVASPHWTGEGPSGPVGPAALSSGRGSGG